MSEKTFVGGLLVTHGQLAQELLAVARMIVGEIHHIVPVSIGWYDDVEASKKVIEDALGQVDRGKGVLILTDMFGGTPSNLSLSFLKKGELEIVTGVNLPMVIKLANQSGDESLPEFADIVRSQGRKHISVASELLGE